MRRLEAGSGNVTTGDDMVVTDVVEEVIVWLFKDVTYLNRSVELCRWSRFVLV